MISNRKGFTLIELLVGIAIMVALAAVVTPVLVSSVDRARVDAGITSLEEVVAGVLAFHRDTGDYPSSLAHLAGPVSSNDANSCGQNFGGSANAWAGPYLSRLVPSGGVPVGIGTAQVALVRDPPTGKDIPPGHQGSAGGKGKNDGSGEDSDDPDGHERVCWAPGWCFWWPSAGGSGGSGGSGGAWGDSGTLSIRVSGVSEADALAVDDRLDGDASRAAGTVQWSAPDAQGLVLLSFVIPIAGC